MNAYGVKEADFDEVYDAQKNFRILMDSMSRPGEVFKLCNNNFIKTPQGFNPNFITILKTLGDNIVSFSLGNIQSEEIQKYIEVNTGMHCANLSEADYVLFKGCEFDERIMELNLGTFEFPEKSATLIIETENILQGKFTDSFRSKVEITMMGSGIKDKNIVTICGIDKRYIEGLININSMFPIGVDVIFVDHEGNLTCACRTTKLEVE